MFYTIIFVLFFHNFFYLVGSSSDEQIHCVSSHSTTVPTFHAQNSQHHPALSRPLTPGIFLTQNLELLFGKPRRPRHPFGFWKFTPTYHEQCEKCILADYKLSPICMPFRPYGQFGRSAINDKKGHNGQRNLITWAMVNEQGHVECGQMEVYALEHRCTKVVGCNPAAFIRLNGWDQSRCKNGGYQ